MLTRKIVVSLAAGVLVCGAGVASALADGAPSTPVVTAGDVQNGQQGVDEQGAANEIAAAANDVQSEVESEAADDQSGDQQGPNDQSEEAGDVQNGQQGVDEQGAANEIASAANDVQSEVESEAADDQSGDQQGASDQSDQAGDNAQSAQENND